PLGCRGLMGTSISAMVHSSLPSYRRGMLVVGAWSLRSGEDLMRSYTPQHQTYGSIALHARTMYVCIMNHNGELLVHPNDNAHPTTFLTVIAPYRDAMVVAVACLFTWYGLADLCAGRDRLRPRARALQESPPWRQRHTRSRRCPENGAAPTGGLLPQ